MTFNESLIDELLSGSVLSHAMVSLFTDRYDPNTAEETGFWADSPSLGSLKRWGSGLRRFQREKITADSTLALENEILQSLQWLISDNLVKSLSVEIERNGTSVKAEVKLNGTGLIIDAI